MATTTLSQKYQIVVPLQVRKKLRLSSGMKLSLFAIDETRAVLAKEPLDYVQVLKGLGKEVWQALGGVDVYIKEERSVWQKP